MLAERDTKRECRLQRTKKATSCKATRRAGRIVVCLCLRLLGATYSLLCGVKRCKNDIQSFLLSFQIRTAAQSAAVHSCAARPKQKAPNRVLFVLEATPGFEPGDRGVADLCLTTWPCRLIAVGVSRLYYHIPFREYWLQKIGRVLLARSFGADYGDRTRHLDLGKVALYQMS